MLESEAPFGFCGDTDHCGVSSAQKLVFGRGTTVKVDLSEYRHVF